MIPERVSFEQLAGIAMCLGLAVLAHALTLPAWVLGTVAACALLRLAMARSARGPPPQAVLIGIAAVVIALLFLRFRTFNGLPAGTALLALMAGLKLLESRTRRDIYVVTLIIYFVSVAALLDSDSFWLLAYLVFVVWLTTSMLLRLTSAQQAPSWVSSARYGARILGQALPLTLVFWLFFPRFAGPLWQTPLAEQSASTGLSNSMTPGDITQLATSDEVAFRVYFDGAVPPATDRYYRGPVLHEFDGRTWRASFQAPLQDPLPTSTGRSYHYTVSLEPHQHNWIFALEWPSQWSLPRGMLTSDYTLVQPEPVYRPLDVTITSHPELPPAQSLGAYVRQRDSRPTKGRNPRTLALAKSMHAAYPDVQDYIAAVLHMIAAEPFYYTLKPPGLGEESVDEFLFDSKRGFCGHYASAFAVLMRDAGFPARVVTGYLGGSLNRYGNYWIVRQSDAHAWDEVWIEGKGWLRVDPTSAIAPERVLREVNEGAAADEPLANGWRRRTPWLTDLRLRLDALREVWRQRILGFDQSSQQRMLERLHIPEPDGQKLVILLAATLALALAWLTWQVRRELNPASADAAIRAYQRLCAKLSAIGLPRRPSEGPEAYAARVGAARPDLNASVTALCLQYSALRYAPPTRASAKQLLAAVRAFRPRTRPSTPT